MPRHLTEWLLWTIVGVFAAILFLTSCGGGGGDAEPALRLVGATPSRDWRGRDHVADAQAMSAHRTGLAGLELQACVKGKQRRCRKTPDEWCPDPVQAAARARAMRAHGVTTLVNVVNANGCLEQDMTAEQFAELVETFRREVGSTDDVILGAVSEPFAAGSFEFWRELTAIARAIWPGAFAMPARSGSGSDLSPAFPEIDFTWIDFHACKDSLALTALAVPGVIVSTDCRGMLDVGPDRARRLVRQAIATGGVLNIYGGPGQDVGATRLALGQELAL